MTALREFIEQTCTSSDTSVKNLPDIVVDELGAVLTEGMDELRADCMILTLLSPDGKRQIANPPFILADRFEFLRSEVPGSFQNPLAGGPYEITSVFGRRSFPRGFSGSVGTFDRLVREKSFCPVTAKTAFGDVVAIICGINFADEFNGHIPVMPFQRSRISGSWCTIQDRISEVLSEEDSTMHFAFRSALSHLAELKRVSSADFAGELCLQMLGDFGVEGITLFRVVDDRIEIIDNRHSRNTHAHLAIRSALGCQMGFLENEILAIEAVPWRAQRNSTQVQGSHLYMSDGSGIGIHMEAQSADTSLHARILLTSLLERMLWALNSSLSPVLQ